MVQYCYVGRCLYRKKMAFVVCVRGGAGPPCVREGTDLIFFRVLFFFGWMISIRSVPNGGTTLK